MNSSFEKINELRKNIINVYEETSSWDDAYSNFMEGNCAYFVMMMKVMYPEGIIMMEQGGGHVAISINDMVFDVRGLSQKENFYEANSEDALTIDTALLPGNNEEREARDKQYAMLINNVIDTYYPELADRKVLPEELEDYIFDDLLPQKKKVA